MDPTALSRVLGLMNRLHEEDLHINAMYRRPPDDQGQRMCVPCPWSREGVDARQFTYERASHDEKSYYLSPAQLVHVHPRLPDEDVDHSMGCSPSRGKWIVAQKVAALVRERAQRLVHDHGHVCKFRREGSSYTCPCSHFTVPAKLLLVDTKIGDSVNKRLHLCTPYCQVCTEDGLSEVFHPGALLILEIEPVFCDESLKYHICDSTCSMGQSMGRRGRNCPLGRSSTGAFMNDSEHFKTTSGTLPQEPKDPTEEQVRNSRFVQGQLQSPAVPFQPLGSEWPDTVDIHNKVLVDPHTAAHLLGAFPRWAVPRDICLQQWPPSTIDSEGNEVVDTEKKMAIIKSIRAACPTAANTEAAMEMRMLVFPGRDDLGLTKTIPLSTTRKRRTLRQIVRNHNSTMASNEALYKGAGTVWCNIYGPPDDIDPEVLASARRVVHAFLFSNYRIEAEESINDSYYPIAYFRKVLSTRKGRISVHMWTLCIALEIMFFCKDVYAAVERWGLIPGFVHDMDVFVYFVLVEMFSRDESRYVQQVSPSSYLPLSHMIMPDGTFASLGWTHGALSSLAADYEIDVSRKAKIASVLDTLFDLEEKTGGFVYNVHSMPLQDVIEWANSYMTSVDPLPPPNTPLDVFTEKMEMAMAEFYLSSYSSAKQEYTPSLSILSYRDDVDYYRRLQRTAQRAKGADKIIAAVSSSSRSSSRKARKRVDGSPSKTQE